MEHSFRRGCNASTGFTCDGAGVSPPLEWEDVPDGTQSFALVCEDPDAPSGLFIHWLLYNLSAGSRELEEGIPRDEVLSSGARQGTNSFGDIGYGGACPPKGDREHRYIFKLHALDTDLALGPLTETSYDRDTHFMLFEVAGDQLYFQAISRTGDTVDSGVITRSKR